MPPPSRLEATPCPVCGSSDARPRYTGLDISGLPTALVVCRGCSAGYISPRPVGDDLYRQYVDPDYLAYHYNELYLPTIPAVVEYTRRTVKIIEAFAKRGTLLDFGGGVGPLAAAAQDAGWQTAGYDVSPIASEKGREILGTRIIGDWDAVLASELAPFDVVAAIEVVEHVENPREVIRQAMSALRPGGLLVVSTPNFASLGRIAAGARWHAILPASHIVYFTPRALRRVLQECGARPIKIFSWGNDIGRLPWRQRLLRVVTDPPGGPNLLALARKPL